MEESESRKSEQISLHDAARLGRVKCIEKHLKEGVPVDEPDLLNEETPLILAAKQGHVHVVRLLLRHGANVNKVDKNGCNALLAASGCKSASGTRWGRVEIVRLFVKNTSINHQNKAGDTALMLACESKNKEIIDELLKNKADIHVKNKMKDTAFHYACKAGNLQVVEELAKRGADVVRSNVYGCSPLMSAAACGHFSVVKFLLTQGIDINARNRHRYTAFSLAAISANPDMEFLKLLVKSGANTFADKKYPLKTPILSQAIDRGSLPVVKYLTSLGHDINERDEDGCTPLMHAVRQKHVGVVEHLIKEGCVLDQTDRKGTTAADTLIFKVIGVKTGTHRHKYREMLLLMMKAGATICVKDYSKSLFHRMIVSGDREMVQLMFARGMSPNPVPVIHNQSPSSALFTALRSDQCDIAKFFISNWFLSKSDRTILCQWSTYGDSFNCNSREIAEELSSQPWSLTCLSYITVSNALGYYKGRNERINQLQLPPMLKEKLLRQDEMSNLPIAQWNEIQFSV